MVDTLLLVDLAKLQCTCDDEVAFFCTLNEDKNK